MYKSIEILNFRGFRDFQLTGLAQVNLFAGKNNVGKTALLEAIFLHAGRGNVRLPGFIDTIRGRAGCELQPASIWGWLFWEKRTEEVITIRAELDDGSRPAVVLKMVAKGYQKDVLFPDKPSASSTADFPLTLEMQFDDKQGNQKTARAYVESGELRFDPPQAEPQTMGIYLNPRSQSGRDTAERCSKLDALGGLPQIVEVLRQVDPRVRRIGIGIEASVPPYVMVDLGLREALPVHVAGAGLSRLIEILLATAFLPEKGVMLVDEVESGLHFTAYRDLWVAIEKAVVAKNIQVFLSTHSLESMKAAAEVFRDERADVLAVFRLERIADKIKAVRYSARELEETLEADLEPRGYSG